MILLTYGGLRKQEEWENPMSFYWQYFTLPNSHRSKMAKKSINIFLVVIICSILGVSSITSKCCRISELSVDCSNCNLAVFPQDFLCNETAIVSLDLTNNNLSHIPDRSFENMKSLKKLLLAENPVAHSYTRETFQGKSIN